jgi:hypothetical protein
VLSFFIYPKACSISFGFCWLMAPAWRVVGPSTALPLMMTNVRFVGLDVHAETIAVAAAEPAGRTIYASDDLGVDSTKAWCWVSGLCQRKEVSAGTD